MKEACRICARELRGNQRRWIFHPAAKLNLQVLLSHALRRSLQRDGRREFICSKCCFMLDRMFRFDTVIARVQALSLERLRRLLQEREQLRQCITALYNKNNGLESSGATEAVHGEYCALLQEDLMYCMQESWAGDEEEALECSHNPRCSRRRCRDCRALRVPDSHYEAVCKVPRKVARSISCGLSSRYPASGADEQTTTSNTLLPETSLSDSQRTLRDCESCAVSLQSLDKSHRAPEERLAASEERLGASEEHLAASEERLAASEERLAASEERLAASEERLAASEERLAASEEHLAASEERLAASEERLAASEERLGVSEERLGASEERLGASEERLAFALSLLQDCVYRPIRTQRGSKLPVLMNPAFFNERDTLDSPDQENLFDGVNHMLEEPELDLVLEELWEQEEYLPFCLRSHPKSLIEEQQLHQYEHAAGQCVNELQQAQLQLESLQNQIHQSETSNKEKRCEIESELRSIRQAAQNQERTIQNLTDNLRTKDTETQELYRVIKGQNNTLRKITETHQQQLQHTQTPEGGVDSGLVLGSQSSLFSCQLELEASQRAHRLTQRRLEDLTRERERLQNDFQEALQHRDVSHKHNQELREMVEQLRSELQVKVCELRDCEASTRSEITDRDKSMAQLQQSLCRKDVLLQEYAELQNDSCDSSGREDRDALLQTLRSRIRDRDAALERSIDEKFRCLEEKDGEVRRLQLVLREKDRDLERLRCVLDNNNDTITGLDALVRSKDLDLERTQESCRKLEWMNQQSDEKHTLAVRERDGIIHQLQTALRSHSRESEELRSVLLGEVSATDVLQELQSHLSVKEHLFQEVMSDRSRQAQEHHRQLTELLHTISSRDQDMKDYGQWLGRVISERSGQLQELRRQLASREQELNDVNRQREKDVSASRELQRLQDVLKEKDTFIQELLRGPSEMLNSTPAPAQAVCTSSSGDLDVQAIRDELQLTLKKDRETERELSEMRSVLAAGRYDTSSSDQQCVLQQLVSEQQALNEALRAEKSVYEKLRRVQSQDDSSAEKPGALHAELDSLQALRQQLVETLTRARETALVLDRAALIQTDYGESSSDEDEDDCDSSSSEEFPDSIEDDEIKLTAQSLTSAQRAEEFGRELMSHNASEQRNQDESETGCSSLARSRNALNEDESGLAADEEESVRCRGSEKHETERPNSREPQRVYRTFREEEEEEYDDEDREEGEDVRGPQGKRGPPSVKLREGRWKRRCTRPHSLDLGALLSHKPAAQHTVQDVGMKREVVGDSSGLSTGGGGAIGFWQHVEVGLREQAEHLRSDLAVSRQESRELQERLMVSEATVQAQAEQLKDYRELLTESAVQQDSKQVQVDLQDLGYETSGRSENEAERDDTSSPEFDELEMGVSLSVSVSRRSGWNADSDGTQTDDPSSLKRLVQDLRSQLSRCHKVIRGLQLRIRSLSNTSDYASSLERTPRKVNWAFQVSSAHSGADEDEGWQSDGPLRPSRELQELVSRVTLLETQIRSSAREGKSGPEDGKCATWPGKYNTLIQAQARELSHLRQKMREGQGICHILTQHLSDTTKAFEELLRANDIDYYMGQSFREQLSQSSSLAHRVSTKISGRDRSEQQDDKTGHELLALRLSKELQHKDQIIESLHTQLQQRSDTPCSIHAPSETTDQSDCTSFVSNERGSTNEDVDLCSDMDAASEFPQEEPQPKDRGVFTGLLPSSQPLIQTQSWPAHSNPMTFTPLTCPDPERRILTVPAQRRPPMRTFSAPHSLSSYQLTVHSIDYTPVSHHALGNSGGPSLQTDALWDMENMIQPIRGFDGSSYYQSGNSQSVPPTNIFIQSHDAVSQLTNEVRALKEENMALQSRLQASRDCSEEAEQLREAVLSGRVRLQQAELVAEQWKEELRRLQTHNCEQSQQIQQLRQDRQNSQEHNNRLQHEVTLLLQQLAESRQLLHSLQSELQLYDRVCGVRKSAAAGLVCGVRCPAVELGELLVEVRALRAQLERSVQENSALRAQLQKQLDHCIDQRPSPIIPASPLRDVLYRRQLLHDPSPSPPVRDVGPLYSPYSEMEESAVNTNDSLEPHADLEGEAPDGSFANRNGRHAIGHVDDYSALQQQVMEGRVLVQRMEAALQSSLSSALLEISGGKALDYSTVKTLLSDTKTLCQILDEAVSLLKMFWRAALPSSDGPAHLIQREQSMREEIQLLRLRIAEQEEVLQGTIQSLRCSNRTKESMETFIVNQLSRTRDVLKKARVNLEKNELRISSISSSSSSLCHGNGLGCGVCFSSRCLCRHCLSTSFCEISHVTSGVA
ncbi:myomegalin-like isoform X2 [Sinocyclocheilus rhinocerous]|uniref:myomegalin-like isoform X2 n=1 Tax=Sinocyclocheilus rhinocerous TaxID=307959 RepID=UPI0007B8509C|nr:PREDICTED: myomegalin-like isoform X2 [Sinocyclocheilus rhinocerous]